MRLTLVPCMETHKKRQKQTEVNLSLKVSDVLLDSCFGSKLPKAVRTPSVNELSEYVRLPR